MKTFTIKNASAIDVPSNNLKLIVSPNNINDHSRQKAAVTPPCVFEVREENIRDLKLFMVNNMCAHSKNPQQCPLNEKMNIRCEGSSGKLISEKEMEKYTVTNETFNSLI